MSKYAPLKEYLQSSRKARVPMTFGQLERLLGFRMPASSRAHRAWWANNPTGHVNSQAWHDAGFRSAEVEAERLVFVKLNHPDQCANPPRHPIFGAARGNLWLAPGVDLAAPADPEWADVVGTADARDLN